MFMATYRVLVRGKFDRPDEVTREKLLAALAAENAPGPLFSAEGTLTYSHHLGGFSYRVEVRHESGEDAQARDQGELMAMELLECEGYPYRALETTSTCMDDIKIKRRR